MALHAGNTTLHVTARVWSIWFFSLEAVKNETEFYAVLARNSSHSAGSAYLKQQTQWKTSGKRFIADHGPEEGWTALLRVIGAQARIKRFRQHEILGLSPRRRSRWWIWCWCRRWRIFGTHHVRSCGIGFIYRCCGRSKTGSLQWRGWWALIGDGGVILSLSQDAVTRGGHRTVIQEDLLILPDDIVMSPSSAMSSAWIGCVCRHHEGWEHASRAEDPVSQGQRWCLGSSPFRQRSAALLNLAPSKSEITTSFVGGKLDRQRSSGVVETLEQFHCARGMYRISSIANSRYDAVTALSKQPRWGARRSSSKINRHRIRSRFEVCVYAHDQRYLETSRSGLLTQRLKWWVSKGRRSSEGLQLVDERCRVRRWIKHKSCPDRPSSTSTTFWWFSFFPFVRLPGRFAPRR
jgi:hypothetical protein